MCTGRVQAISVEGGKAMAQGDQHPAAGPSAPESPGAVDAALPDQLKTFPDPAPRLIHFEQYKYLVCYDVRDDGRLQRIFKRMKDFGKPVQKSVFECLLKGRDVEAMWEVVLNTIEIKEDWVALFRLSKPFDEAIRHVGVYDPQHLHSDDVLFI